MINTSYGFQDLSNSRYFGSDTSRAAIPFGMEQSNDGANEAQWIQYAEYIRLFVREDRGGEKKEWNKFVPFRRRSDKKGQHRRP
jgi:hypothetical protein